jgi:MFS family permease
LLESDRNEFRFHLSTAHRWSIVLLLCIAFIVAYFDRQNLSYALTDPEFKRFFNLSELDRGLLNSAFFWSYTLLQIPGGWFIDRYGVRLPFAACFFMWSVVSGLTAFAQTIGQLFGLRCCWDLENRLTRPPAFDGSG